MAEKKDNSFWKEGVAALQAVLHELRSQIINHSFECMMLKVNIKFFIFFLNS